MTFIFLLGVHGSGKTTTAKELAKVLNLDFLDLDKEGYEILKRYFDFGKFRLTQGIFFTSMLQRILEKALEEKSCVFSNHPLSILAYNFYYLREECKEILKVLKFYLKEIEEVIIFLEIKEKEDFEKIIERIKNRKREVLIKIEKEVDGIIKINTLLEFFLEKYKKIKRNVKVIKVRAGLELEERVREILNLLKIL